MYGTLKRVRPLHISIGLYLQLDPTAGAGFASAKNVFYHLTGVPPHRTVTYI